MSRPRLSGSSQSAVLLGTDGDGATLSVDFTGGSLGPFVLTRLSSATYVDSTGTIRYAPSNLIVDTPIASAPTFPWNPFTSGQGLNTLVDGVVTSNSSTVAGQNGRAFYRQTISSLGVGLRYSMSIDILSESGGEQANLCLTPSNASGIVYYLNGADIASTDPVEPGILTVIWTSTATSTEMRIGVGTNTTSTDKIVTWTRPRMKAGFDTAVEFIENTSTSAAYEGPRFTFNPDTLAPEGLLVEPTRENFCLNSVDQTAATWSMIASGGIVSGQLGPSPDGTFNATRIQPGSGGLYLQGTLATLPANTVVTQSVFVKTVGSNPVAVLSVGTAGAWVGSGATLVFNFANPASSTLSGTYLDWSYTPYKNGWYRLTLTMTTTATPAGAAIRFRLDNGVTADGYLVYGPQVEIQQGATSYIPTGSSSQVRAQDAARITPIDFLSFNGFNSTILCVGRQYCFASGFARLISVRGISTGEALGMAVGSATLYGTSRSNTTTVIAETTRTNTLRAPMSFAFSLDANDAAAAMRVSLNGSGTSAARQNPGPAAASTLFTMNENASAAAYGAFSVKSIKFFPSSKTVAELNTLTAQ